MLFQVHAWNNGRAREFRLIVVSVGPIESDDLVCIWALVLGNGLYWGVFLSIGQFHV